ncbi:hypothetical protein BS333_14825 [Vibrio azureus]|uniref:BRCT domain-containing protein n=1 Tax=Vibrio azureus NBRC 104587 TaxID=1219077 RepID=U3ASD7_9VIBR|nr:hypothetical protein [Vibrio azureus]AUI87679.1 hypothetical protein BS333_14825 [Vibrio azureus]GAD76670.1 hypothetical protein VAZ01S_049_00360 [Vibrio azureus NBRC 104587]
MESIKSAIEEADGQFICIYKDAKGNTSVQELANAKHTETEKSSYIQGWSYKHKHPITLKTERVLGVFDSADDADFHLESKADFASDIIINLPKRAPNSSEKTFDVCFTGFDKDTRESLTRLAESKSMLVRKSVTVNLDILCFGPNAGPAKVNQATMQGVTALTKSQFENLLDTGELPEALPGDITVTEAKERARVDEFEDLVKHINTNLKGLKEFPRRENLIATFHDEQAVGWKFYVHQAFRDALDIKLTPVTVHSKTYQTWTQGHAYSFKRGDTLSWPNPNKDWGAFLNADNAIMLQVKFATPAGFVENQRLEGTFQGNYFKTKTHAQSKDVLDAPIEVASYIYDSGVLTVGVYRPDETKEKVELVDTLLLTQVEFVTLLQSGYYWQKPTDSEDDTPVKKIVLVE